LFKNPKVDKDLVKGLQNFLKDSDAPENLKLNSIKYFAENEIKRIKKERLKNKQKSQFRGRIPEEYLTEATLRAIKSHQKVNKNETRKETIKRVCLLYKDKAHSEDAFTKSVMNRWNSLTADFNKKKELKKITSDFKTYTENRLKKQKKAHKQRLKRNQAGKN
jgi:CRISPR/Cas system-associated endoribonuclease Cas2